VRRPPTRKAGAALAGVLLFGGGCTYYNALYNAEHLYAEAERLRREGRDAVAAPLYEDVIRKAAHGFRREPSGRWAYEAAYLLGRAHLRLGDLDAAGAALSHSAGLADDPDRRLAAHVYSGVVHAALGEQDAALSLFNQALAGATDPAVRAEGHLHRGRLLLELGIPDAGWWDLDRAAEAYPPLQVEANLERLRWGVALGDRARADESVQRLLALPRASARAVDLMGALSDAEHLWGPDAVAEMLRGAREASWDRDARDALVLERADLHLRAGRRSEAEVDARTVAGGRGDVAARARMALAGWTLGDAFDLGEAYRVRALLLPALDVPEVAALTGAIDQLEDWTFAGVDDPLAWFRAGELARDALGAPGIARGLFLAYAGAAPDEPWAPKALLAALYLTEPEAGRAELRERLERYPDSPYVLAARGRPAVGFEALEEALVVRLNEVGPR